jgi:hypothetical protein
VNFTTEFDGIEYPLSESGRWRNNGGFWTFVRKEGGAAYGSQSGDGGYDDSYAYLVIASAANPNIAPPDITLTATISLPNPTTITGTHEVELLLRWADGAKLGARGYEVLFSYGGQVGIVRWEGPFGTFTELAGPVNVAPFRDDDIVSASIVGGRIAALVNSVEVLSYTDTKWADGAPGIGFFKRVGSPNSDFGFKRFTATS